MLSLSTSPNKVRLHFKILCSNDSWNVWEWLSVGFLCVHRHKIDPVYAQGSSTSILARDYLSIFRDRHRMQAGNQCTCCCYLHWTNKIHNVRYLLRRRCRSHLPSLLQILKQQFLSVLERVDCLQTRLPDFESLVDLWFSLYRQLPCRFGTAHCNPVCMCTGRFLWIYRHSTISIWFFNGKCQARRILQTYSICRSIESQLLWWLGATERRQRCLSCWNCKGSFSSFARQ